MSLHYRLKRKKKGGGNEKSLGIVDIYSFAKEKDKENTS